MAVELSTQLQELTVRLEDVTKERDSYRSLYQEALLLIKRLERGLLGPKTEKLPNDAQLTIDILRLVMGDESESSPPISHQEEDIQDETASNLVRPGESVNRPQYRASMWKLYPRKFNWRVYRLFNESGKQPRKSQNIDEAEPWSCAIVALSS